MAQFAPAGSGGLPPAQVSFANPTTPSVLNLAMPSAATEYSIALPAGTVRYEAHLRSGSAVLQLAYSVGTSGTTYTTVPAGCGLAEGPIASTASVTLYVQSPKGNQVLEIIYWT